MRTIVHSLIVFLFSALAVSCTPESEAAKPAAGPKKIGVLFVNHGSRSATWRQALLDLETHVRDSILSGGVVQGVKTAFMEYNEPSIATRLKEFDAENYTDVVIVPVFLTVSPHSFDDIPTIIGQKEDPQSMEVLKIEKIERYTPKARTHITPLLDFTEIVRENVLARVKKLSVDPAKEGVVLLAYGDETYMKEWSDLLDKVGQHVESNTGMSAHSWGWCGHVAHYSPDSTSAAINRVLATKEKAVVIPVLVAHDEMFQVQIIGDGIAQIPGSKEKVAYVPDAILPDKSVENWVIAISTEYVNKIAGEKE